VRGGREGGREFVLRHRKNNEKSVPMREATRDADAFSAQELRDLCRTRCVRATCCSLQVVYADSETRSEFSYGDVELMKRCRRRKSRLASSHQRRPVVVLRDTADRCPLECCPLRTVLGQNIFRGSLAPPLPYLPLLFPSSPLPFPLTVPFPSASSSPPSS